MTVKDLLWVLGGVDQSAEVVVRTGMGVMPIVAVQMVTDLQNTAQRRVHLTLSPDMNMPFVDVNARLADAIDRIAPKKDPWDEP